MDVISKLVIARSTIKRLLDKINNYESCKKIPFICISDNFAFMDYYKHVCVCFCESEIEAFLYSSGFLDYKKNIHTIYCPEFTGLFRDKPIEKDESFSRVCVDYYSTEIQHLMES